MRAFVVGTAGHVDHGKTELVRALTGVETDRWEEEKERGLTIDLGFAPLWRDEELEVGLVDVPGHEDFVKNMLAGATGVDLLLLVVAADEGPMPQTREHLTIARVLGVREGVVALSKVDRVEEEWVELAREAVEEELRTVLGHADWPVIPVSSTEGQGVEAVREEIERRAEAVSGRPERDLFRLPVDRSFTVRGAGTVLTGTVWSGRVELEDEVRVLPGDHRPRVRSLQVHGEDRPEVTAGRRCALALAGLEPGDAPRGSTVVKGDAWRTVRALGVRLSLPTYVGREVEDGQRVRVYLGTREAMARADLTEDRLRPGEAGWARLRLEAPVVARARDPYILRFYSPVTTLGGGRVAALDPAGDWPRRTGEWAELLGGPPPAALRAAVGLRGGRGLPTGEVPLATGLSTEAASALEASAPDGLIRVGGAWFRRESRSALRSSILEELGRLQEEHRRETAVSLEALRAAVGGEAEEALVDDVLEELTEEGEVVVEGPRVRTPGHRPELTEEEEAQMARIRERVREGGLEPPTVPELGDELGVPDPVLHDLLRLLVEEGALEPVDREIYLAEDVAGELRRRAVELLREEGRAGAAEFKEMLGVTRKYLIPLLEHLDRTGLTRRTGEGRVLRAEAAPEAGEG